MFKKNFPQLYKIIVLYNCVYIALSWTYSFFRIPHEQPFFKPLVNFCNAEQREDTRLARLELLSNLSLHRPLLDAIESRPTHRPASLSRSARGINAGLCSRNALLLTFDYTPRSRASQVTPSPLTFEVWIVRKRSFAYETQQHHMG